MDKPKLLDLFCGAGGASYGYMQAGFHVTGVDINPQPRYKGDIFIQADALDYVAGHGWKYAAIHASPPCEQFSRLTPTAYRKNHLNLIPATRYWLQTIGVPYVIENVPDAVHLLHNPLMLCGTMFGLKIQRHRYFECSWGLLFSPFVCCHDFYAVLISGTTRRKSRRFEYTVQQCRDASGIDWMTRTELDKAIPPAYTLYIGKQLMTTIEGKALAVETNQGGVSA